MLPLDEERKELIPMNSWQLLIIVGAEKRNEKRRRERGQKTEHSQLSANLHLQVMLLILCNSHMTAELPVWLLIKIWRNQ